MDRLPLCVKFQCFSSTFNIKLHQIFGIAIKHNFVVLVAFRKSAFQTSCVYGKDCLCGRLLLNCSLNEIDYASIVND
jgi:hypothetical protein